MEYEEAMRLQIEELIDEKTALRAQLMGKTTAEAIKMAFDNGDSYLESVLVRAKRAEAERDALRAQLAAATERAEKAEHLLEVSEDYRRAYQDGKYKMYASDDEDVREAAAKYLPCNEGPLERVVDAVSGSAQLKRLNCALAARVAELEGAMKTIDKELCVISEGKQEEIRNDISSGEAAGWTGAHDHVGPIILSALSRTPAQSLAACKAAALREVAKDLESTEINATRITASGVRDLFVYRLLEMAERLEAEAAHG